MASARQAEGLLPPATRTPTSAATKAEHNFNAPNQWRGMVNRYDKLALAYRSAVVLQAVVIWSAALEKSGLGHPRVDACIPFRCGAETGPWSWTAPHQTFRWRSPRTLRLPKKWALGLFPLPCMCSTAADIGVTLLRSRPPRSTGRREGERPGSNRVIPVGRCSGDSQALS